MTATNALIQGIIQGLTEFLPVSSSGHLALFQYFTGQNETSGMMFSIFLHMGTLLAVFLAFYKTIAALVMEFIAMVSELIKGKFSMESLKGLVKTDNPNRRMILLLIVSMIPMAFSLFLLDYFDRVSGDNDIIVEGGCFLITCILLFLADSCVKGHKTAADMKYRDAVAIGTIQALAPFPGISRSGSTISIGLLAGLNCEFAIAFSFIMGIPPVLGANIMELARASESSNQIPAQFILIGIGASLVFGLLAIRLVKWLVTSERFKIFAWYTMVLGVLTIAVGIFERLTNHMIQELVVSMMGYIQ